MNDYKGQGLMIMYLVLLVDHGDPLVAATEEACGIIQLHHGTVPGRQLAVAHVLSVHKAPLTPVSSMCSTA